MKIRYLKNHEINFVRWDNCINNALNGSVFAYSWYLNILCEEWAALIMDDYKYVMPLIFKTKFNKTIFYSHKFGNRLGVFSNLLLTENIVKEFVNAIPEDNSSISISFNKSNKLNFSGVKSLKTYELDLIQSHKKISEKYSNQFQKNLQIARTNKITIIKGLLPNDLINFSSTEKVQANPDLNKNDIHHLRMIVAYCLRFSLGETYSAYTENNSICAVAFFIKSKRKLHLLYAAANSQGIKSNAFHLLIDKYIEVHSEKDLTLNLENVVSKNNVDFFSGIGAFEYKYNHYYKNNLPWIYKLLIKNN